MQFIFQGGNKHESRVTFSRAGGVGQLTFCYPYW